MKRRRAVFTAAFLFACAYTALASPHTPATAQLDLRISWDKSVGDGPHYLIGTATFSGLLGGANCFLLPANDRSLIARSRATSRFSDLAARQPLKHDSESFMEVDAQHDFVLEHNSSILRINAADGSAEIRFRTKVSGLVAPLTEPVLLDGFYPLLLQDCPQANSVAAINGDVELRAIIDPYPSWELLSNSSTPSPKMNNVLHVQRYGGELALVAHDSHHHRVMDVAGMPVHLLSGSDNFERLADMVSTGMIGMTSLFGPFLEKQVVVIDSSESSRATIPGIVSLERPKQSLFASLQTYWLNWSHWTFMCNLAAQWFGASLRAESMDYQWLSHGMTDFAAFYVLKLDGIRFNLFNAYDSGASPVQFNYREIQDVSAALMQKDGYRIPLVTEQLFATVPFDQTHPMAFVRHTFALRETLGRLGEGAFQRWLRTVTQRLQGKPLNPSLFLNAALDSLGPDPSQRRLMESSFLYWWATAQWPDYYVVGFSNREIPGDGYLASVLVGVDDGIKSPVEVQVIDDRGREYRSHAKARDDGLLVADIITSSEPTSASIDPGRAHYDRDRFNNSTQMNSLDFLPGSANGLADNGYTLAWLPYPIKRPGEPFAIGINAALLQYLHQSTGIAAEVSPSDARGALRIRHAYHILGSPLNGELVVDQDRLLRRHAESRATALDIISGTQKIDFSLAGRVRENVGVAATRHGTVAASVVITPRSRYSVGWYKATGEIEMAPAALAPEFSYRRVKGSLELGIRPTQLTTIALRGFSGLLVGTGEVPDLAKFRSQDLSEARLRLDVANRDAPLVNDLVSLNIDIEGPFAIPLPESTLMLTKQIRWRLFHDIGGPRGHQSEYQASGFGIVSPFGGDLVGVGSLALARLTIVVVVDRRTPTNSNYKPSILIDMGSAL